MKESRIFGGSPERIEKAARAFSQKLTELGIPHALIGGLAASTWSEPRATKDVDFLVPAETRAALGGTMLGGDVYGITLKQGTTRIDLLFPESHEGFLEDAIAVAPVVEGMRVLSPEALVYMKIDTGRAKDLNDIIAMLQAGANQKRIRSYLQEHAPDQVDDFDSLALQAELSE